MFIAYFVPKHFRSIIVIVVSKMEDTLQFYPACMRLKFIMKMYAFISKRQLHFVCAFSFLVSISTFSNLNSSHNVNVAL